MYIDVNISFKIYSVSVWIYSEIWGNLTGNEKHCHHFSVKYAIRTWNQFEWKEDKNKSKNKYEMITDNKD